jgi:hypothetical protein
MDRRNHDLAAREPLKPTSLLPAGCGAAAPLAKSTPAKIMTAANDWRRGSCAADVIGCHHPSVSAALEKPLARHLGAGHGAVRHQFIKRSDGRR